MDTMLVALMRDESMDRTYEVYEDVDTRQLYTRLAGTRKLDPVHMGLNPDLDTYLARCANNFGWTTEIL